MKIFKKNQIIITALALMIAAAGYVSYTYGNEEDLTAATSQEVTEDTYDISEEDALLEDDIFTDTEDPALDTAQEESGDEKAVADMIASFKSSTFFSSSFLAGSFAT